MGHAILVSLASAICGAFVIAGAVYVLLRIFNPKLFKGETNEHE
jgi:hypothetical protein